MVKCKKWFSEKNVVFLLVCVLLQDKYNSIQAVHNSNGDEFFFVCLSLKWSQIDFFICTLSYNIYGLNKEIKVICDNSDRNSYQIRVFVYKAYPTADIFGAIINWWYLVDQLNLPCIEIMPWP